MILEHNVKDPTYQIIGSALEVHKILEPGLLESMYESCLAHEFNERGVDYKRQLTLPIIYKEKQIDGGYRIDFLVEEEIIVELKTVDTLLPLHHSQLISYMKLAKKRLGPIINFNTQILKRGIKRVSL